MISNVTTERQKIRNKKSLHSDINKSHFIGVSCGNYHNHIFFHGCRHAIRDGWNKIDNKSSVDKVWERINIDQGDLLKIRTSHRLHTEVYGTSTQMSYLASFSVLATLTRKLFSHLPRHYSTVILSDAAIWRHALFLWGRIAREREYFNFLFKMWYTCVDE